MSEVFGLCFRGLLIFVGVSFSFQVICYVIGSFDNNGSTLAVS